MMRNKLFLLIFVWLTFPYIYGNNLPVSVKGQVVDSLSNETVPYATLRISLAETPQEAVKLLACDIDGKFETTLTQTGRYLLSIQSVGKAPAEKEFVLDGSQRQVNLGKLNMADDTQRLDEITVTAQKPLIKVELDKLTYNLEEDPESQVNNTLDMLRKVPMVTVGGDDEIQLKGSTNFKIYINGKPSNLLSNNPADVLKSMPASSVKNIEVITDPGAKYDAEGVGGIINIITTKNALQGFTSTVRAQASTLGRQGGGVYFSAKAGKLGITANYNYNHENSPWNDAEELFANSVGEHRINQYQYQQGRTKRKGPFQFGNLEASYEIDSLNLVSVGANLFRGQVDHISEMYTWMEQQTWGGYGIPPSDPEEVYSYDRHSSSEATFGSTDVNVDYQRSTTKKDELLTLSYRFSHAPNDNVNNTYLLNVNNYPDAGRYPQWNTNDASTNEHTAQIDYTTPTLENHTFEVGAKYIMRQSLSNTIERVRDGDAGNWIDISSDVSDFRHTQHIYSGYLGYALKLEKYGFKAGIRGEGTALNVKFANAQEQNFSTHFFDLIPNATISYQINMAQQLRIGYNMRIQRPGIWFLNPYVNTANPQNISYGNPNLETEKSNSFNLNYSLFTQKFNINASASYSFVNNGIQRYTFVDPENEFYPDASHSTYGNIAKRQHTGMFLYANWTPVQLFRLYTNGGVDYSDLKSENTGMANSGFSGRIFVGTQFNFPKDIRLNVNGGYFSPWIQLQGKGSPFYFNSFTINKDLLKKNMTVSLSCNNPFQKTLKSEYTTTDPSFFISSINHWNMREFRVNISYRFGSMKDTIKKVQRGISNDDIKGNEGQGGGQPGM